MFLDGSIEGGNDEKLEGAVYETNYFRIKVPDGEVLGSTHGSSYRKKLGGYSLGKSLGEEVGTEVGFFDEISDCNSVGNLRDIEWENHWESNS